VTAPVRRLTTLDEATRAEVEALAERIERADRVAPLNEAALISLRPPTTHETTHLVADGPAGPIGYANLQRLGTALTAQMVVDPTARRTGVGTALLAAARLPADSGVWSFGDLPPARAFAAARGLIADRELLMMATELPDAEVGTTPRTPADLQIRPYGPADETAVLRINARAFAHHPEQGAMDAAEFAARRAQQWYRDEDLLVATRADLAVGFHWTKRHDAETGEVYVLAVDPDAQGGGIGTALLLAGLAHLRAAGIRRVILYVAGDQPVAVHLYRSHGFEVTHRDVMYVPATG